MTENSNHSVLLDQEITPWELQPNVNQQSLYQLLECVMDIAQSMQGLTNAQQPSSKYEGYVQAPLMTMTVRRVSTSIRKILLDGNGSLAKRCFTDPNLHPMIPLVETRPMNFVRPFDEQRITLGWADGISREITRPAFNHTVTVYPLYGVKHIFETRFCINNPFD